MQKSKYEIGDSFIRLLDIVGSCNININKFIDAKMKINDSRPDKHGKVL